MKLNRRNRKRHKLIWIYDSTGKPLKLYSKRTADFFLSKGYSELPF